VGADALLPNFSLHKASLLLQKEKSRAKSASLIQLSPPSPLSLSLSNTRTHRHQQSERSGRQSSRRQGIHRFQERPLSDQKSRMGAMMASITSELLFFLPFILLALLTFYTTTVGKCDGGGHRWRRTKRKTPNPPPGDLRISPRPPSDFGWPVHGAARRTVR
jgi:hypothetical protein